MVSSKRLPGCGPGSQLYNTTFFYPPFLKGGRGDYNNHLKNLTNNSKFPFYPGGLQFLSFPGFVQLTKYHTNSPPPSHLLASACRPRRKLLNQSLKRSR